MMMIFVLIFFFSCKLQSYLEKLKLRKKSDEKEAILEKIYITYQVRKLFFFEEKKTVDQENL